MQKRRHKRNVVYLFSLPVFFLFVLTSSCGIPTFINFDEHINPWVVTTDVTIGDVKFQADFSMNADGLAKIQSSVDEGPGIKFFYALSKDKSHLSFANTIRTMFNSYIRNYPQANNGLEWRSSPDASPGFYIFEKKSGVAGNPVTLQRPDSQNYEQPSDKNILVGTFAVQSTGHDIEFLDSAEMDIAVPANTGTVQCTFDFSSGTLKGQWGNLPEYTLHAYNRASFATFADVAELYESADEDFLTYLGSQTGDELYLHVWASMYGGRGDFNNTYWSPLEYLGVIQLQ